MAILAMRSVVGHPTSLPQKRKHIWNGRLDSPLLRRNPAILRPPKATTEDPVEELAVDRVSSTKGSRKAFCEAFCRMLNLELTNVEDCPPLDPSQSPFPAQQAPFSELIVQKKRPYFIDRDWTDSDIGYLAFFLGMHAIAFIGGPLTFTWDAFLVAFGGYVITGWFGLCLCYHRLLTHKSFRCPKWLEFFFVYCGVLSFEGDPVEWAKNHRWHHIHSDEGADRHSPKDGIWHSHMGWMFDEQLSNTRADQNGNMRDSLGAPWFYKESPDFYNWIRETYMYHQLGQAAVLFVWGGVPYLVWGFVIRILFTMHLTWFVNSAVHVWGNRVYKTGDESRNNWLIALLVFGEGWHNNHHAFEYSAAHGLEWWQFDMTHYMISTLEVLGLAWDVRRPTEKQKRQLAV
ncbi:hypothetical protein BSKO_03556 [Bryopsis sp. KO-2023]|nr:hypothetical protein BSKO_03556 [Bryopsis sp. KO-2023]